MSETKEVKELKKKLDKWTELNQRENKELRETVEYLKSELTSAYRRIADDEKKTTEINLSRKYGIV